MHTRKVLTVLATLSMGALLLSGCTGADDSACAPAGPASDLLKVSANFGAPPEVDFPTPLKTKTTQAVAITPGSGQRASSGQQLSADITLYNATTGALLTQSEYNDASPVEVFLGDRLLPGLVKGLECARADSRVAIVISPDDAFGPSGGYAAFNVSATDSLLAIVDVNKVFLKKANGTPQIMENGLPHVVTAPSGQPGITIPKTDAPTKLKLALLKSGNGDKVKDGDRVLLQYTVANWADNKIVKTTWSDPEPPTLVISDDSSKLDATQETLLPGFIKAVKGERVGSQVLAVIPPKFGYGATDPQNSLADATLVYVIDILGIN